jgi:ribosomal protein S18 acetylase RimI-like enzyme
MRTEFRRAKPEAEMRSLLNFDRKIFPVADQFPADYWRQLHSYWLLVGGVKAGCCAFHRHMGFDEDTREAGSLYIATTGILPRYQGRGLGRLFKAWQVAYARHHCFKRVVTHTRKRNKAMIYLNQEFGFEIVRAIPKYYSEPTDSAVEMELLLPTKRK